MSDARAAFRRYEEIRPRLPVAGFATTSLQMPSLADAADRWDGFMLDAFGVLNVGETAIPGAVARIAELRARGKRLCVLTNAASYTHAPLLAKYHRLGYDFALSEVVSSRDVAARRIAACWPGAHWAAISADGDSFAVEELPVAGLQLNCDESTILVSSDYINASSSYPTFLPTVRFNQSALNVC